MEQNFELRTVFSTDVVNKFADSIETNYHAFDCTRFKDDINQRLSNLQFGERSKLITEKLHQFLPSHFPDAIKILIDSLGPEIEEDELTGLDGFIIMPQCRFVSRYGLKYFDLSMKALYEMTKRFSAEGDIRYFIEQYPEKTMSLLSQWAEDPNCHIRRLVSEGTRPRLPLAARIPRFQKDPEPVFILLEKLKEDPVRYVQRSVANNLNDISKDNPDKVIKCLSKWKSINNPGTYWIIKHALRSLLKAGNKNALELLGFSTELHIILKSFNIINNTISLGDYINFEFEIESEGPKDHNLMIDYAIHFMKSNGSLSGKVFKLSQKTIKPGQSISFQRRFSFKPISTRKYYPGKHRINLIINGRKYVEVEFYLKT